MKSNWKIIVAIIISFLVGISITFDLKEVFKQGVLHSHMSLKMQNETVPAVAADSALETKEIAIADFNEIVSNGAWRLNIISGPKYKIVVTAAPAVWQYIIVSKQDDALHLDFKEQPRLKTVFSEYGSTVEITMPTLVNLHLHGAANALLQNFILDKLFIHTYGISKVAGINNKIGVLSLINSGGHIIMDFHRSVINDVDLDLAGVSRIFLDMQGGDLTGKNSGFANIFYTGQIGKESFKDTGIMRLFHQDAFSSTDIN